MTTAHETAETARPSSLEAIEAMKAKVADREAAEQGENKSETPAPITSVPPVVSEDKNERNTFSPTITPEAELPADHTQRATYVEFAETHGLDPKKALAFLECLYHMNMVKVVGKVANRSESGRGKKLFVFCFPEKIEIGMIS